LLICGALRLKILKAAAQQTMLVLNHGPEIYPS
jgi:hypothetical protein